jgi:hypothetical protein
MRFAYTFAMSTPADAEAAVTRWHEAVNSGDPARARVVVADPIVVNGPRGAGPITPDDFAEWVVRSGITLTPRSYHPVSDRILVVEQDAVWPQDEAATRVATMFRASGGRVSAALRFPALPDALEFAHLYRDLVATESP